jgi:hypothetical protein
MFATVRHCPALFATVRHCPTRRNYAGQECSRVLTKKLRAKKLRAKKLLVV